MRRITYFVGGVFAIVLSLPARAEAAGANAAAAEALFNEGRALLASGHAAQACPKFEASQELDPALGTRLNLGECYEKLGKTASAWAEYRAAIPMARAAGAKARLDLATKRATALEAQLSTVTIRIAADVVAPIDLEVRRDGVLLQAAELGSAIPVDPGPHTVEASAAGKQKWSTTLRVGADANKLVIDVPALQPERSTPAPVASPAPAPVTSSPMPQSGSSQRTVAVVVGAVGVVGLGVGTFFGLQAKSNWSEAKSNCTAYPYGCNGTGLDRQSSASSQATVSTVAFIAGSVALGVGAALWFTAGSSKSESVALGFGPGAAFVRGTFQ